MSDKSKGKRGQDPADDDAREPDWFNLSRKLEGFVPDVVRRAVVTGVRSFLQTEEGLRSVLGAMVPKEAIHYIAQQLDSSKNDVLRVVSRELRDFLGQIDLGGEVQKILTSISFEITTQIRFIPNEKAVKPDVKAGVRVKRNMKAKKQTAEGEQDEVLEDSDEVV
ncbi:MAG: hypothetical protein AMXMBFR64_54210 [Myxococcales bacterium]